MFNPVSEDTVDCLPSSPMPFTGIRPTGVFVDRRANFLGRSCARVSPVSARRGCYTIVRQAVCGRATAGEGRGTVDGSMSAFEGRTSRGLHRTLTVVCRSIGKFNAACAMSRRCPSYAPSVECCVEPESVRSRIRTERRRRTRSSTKGSGGGLGVKPRPDEPRAVEVDTRSRTATAEVVWNITYKKVRYTRERWRRRRRLLSLRARDQPVWLRRRRQRRRSQTYLSERVYTSRPV